MRAVRALISVSLIAISGCAIRPLPEDVTGLSTSAIVHQIRCEARSAVKSQALALLQRSPDPRTQEIGRALERRDLRYGEVQYSMVDPATRKYLIEYDGAAIAYEFTFNITETNKAGVGVGLLQSFSRGPFTLGVGAGTDLSRQNVRNFVMADTFLALLQNMDDEDCDPAAAPSRSTYPISGHIGLAEVVRTFIQLNEMDVLGGKNAGNIPTLADTLTFETTVSASASPVVKLNPVGTHLQFFEANATFSALRKDLHQLVVALSLPPEPVVVVVKQTTTKKTITTTRRAAAPSARTQGFGAALTTGETAAEERALQELTRQRQLRYLENSRILNRSLGLTDF